MNKSLIRVGGVLSGALYGVVLRIFFGQFLQSGDVYSLFSINFLGLIPILIGLIPLFFASDKDLDSTWFPVIWPMLAVLVFFLICFVTRLEDILCIIIISLPYLVAAVVFGIVARTFIVHARKKKKQKSLYSILLLPLLLGPVEQQIDSPVRSYSVSTEIMINADVQKVWSHIIRVPEIKNEEYTKGFFNYAGIPRPLYAELDKETLHATRTGHFEGGLKFVEKVIVWDKYRHIGFDITVVPSSIRKTVFDQHLLKGDHFRFLNATYKLEPQPGGKTKLVLSSAYQLKTKINPYASFWGDQLLTDFQERLLEVIKTRCEQ